MTCEELLVYLSDYLDKQLDTELNVEAEAHLATCQQCQIVVNTTQYVIQLGHNQPPRVMPPQLRDRLMKRLLADFLHQ